MVKQPADWASEKSTGGSVRIAKNRRIHCRNSSITDIVECRTAKCLRENSFYTFPTWYKRYGVNSGFLRAFLERDNKHSMTNDASPIQRSDRARSLFKGLRLLQSFSTGTPRMTLSECAEAVGMNRATARRFLLTLLDLGFLQQEGRYFSLTPKVLTLGYNYLSTLPWWQPSLPIIENVSRALEVACSVGVLSEDELVIVARVQGPSVFSVNLGAGRPLPIHVTAMGRVLLADLSTDMLEGFLSRTDLISLTPATETNPGRLREDLVQVRKQGYSIVDQELELGLRSIAVPISNRNGTAIAALGVSTNTEQCSVEDMVAKVLPIIRDASRAISTNISF